jgi:hypothetical protein
VANAPTITSPALLTGAGLLLGTAAYMSPEQARGKPVDKRADIWAFACVLYEMLTGERAFSGDDVVETLAKVVEREPEWAHLPSATPEMVRRLLRRCLAKEPRRRFADAADVRIAIEDANADLTEAPHAPVTATRPPRSQLTGWWIAAAMVLAAVGAAAAVLGGPWSDTPTQPQTRFRVTAPGIAQVNDLTLSPDGRTLVFEAIAQGKRQLYQRALDGFDARPIPDTDDARSPFFSPDGAWVAFNIGGGQTLKKIPLAGGPAIKVADGPNIRQGSWAADGTMIVSVQNGGLRTVSTGGMLTPLTTLNTGGGGHWDRHRVESPVRGGD